MSRRLARLTLDTLADLPVGCRACVFWELDAVRREQACATAETLARKEAWVSQVLLEWGSCGRICYVDGDPAGYVLYAPPAYLPGAGTFPTAPASDDAVLLATAMVYPQYAHAGLGRLLMQSVVKDLVKRGGVRALEAFGTSTGPVRRAGSPGERGYGGCVLPTDFLLRVGFKTHRPHPRHPRMRLDLKSTVTWREEVEGALGKLAGVIAPPPRPRPHAGTARTH